MALSDILNTASATWQAKDVFGTKADAETRTDAESDDYAIAAWANEVDNALRDVNEASNGEREWGFLPHVIEYSWTQVGDSSSNYAPRDGATEQSNDSYITGFLAPCDGYLDFCVMSATTSTANCDLEMHVGTNQSNATIQGSAVTEQLQSSDAGVRFDFGSASYSFSAGEFIHIYVQPTANVGNAMITAVFRLDWNTQIA